MAGKWVDLAENSILNVYLKGTARPSFYLGIYTNVAEPGEAAVLTDITEPAGSGYARQQIADGDWTVVADLATAAQKTFAASGGAWGVCYGSFICTVASGTAGLLLAVENFPAGPYTINDGGQIKVTSKITAA